MTLRAFLTRLIWICLLPLLGLSAWLAVDHVLDIHASSESAADRLAKTVATAIDHDLGGRIGALRVLAASRLADDPTDLSGLYEEAQGFRRSFGIDVVCAGLDGRMLFHTARPLAETLPVMPSSAGRSAVTVAISTGAPAVGDLFRGPIVDEAMVAIAAPGVREGRTTFVMVGAIPARLLDEQLRDFKMPPGWSVVLRDSLGETIARRAADSPPEDDAGRTTFEAQLVAAPWTVALEVPRADYLAPVASAAVAMVLALVGATLAGVLGGAWASRRLAHSVRALTAPAAAPVPDIAIEEIGTARRQLVASTRALELREAQLRSIFDSASDAILTIDASQTVVVANSAAARMFGCEIDEMVGGPLERFIPDRHRERHRAYVEAFGATGVTVRGMGDGAVELSALRAGGQEFPIEASISRVDVDGRRLYTVILRDITERRRAERELHASKAKLEAALASMTDAVAIVAADGSFVDFNEAFATYHRFATKAECPRASDAFGATIELSTPEGTVLPIERRPAQRALAGERATNVELRVRRTDTDQCWFGSYGFAPIRDGAGAISGAVVTARDITAARQAESDLKASHADLQRLIAAVDSVQEEERKRIARELHDDLQQTLAAALMEAEAIRGELDPGASAARTGLDRIQRRATTAIMSTRRIINDLRPQLLEELGLIPALHALAQRFREQTGIACNVEPDHFISDVGPHGSAVDTCLFRVTQEALNNAAKHAGAKLVTISLSIDAGGRRRLTVRDDGRGIAPEDRSREGSFGLLGMAERVRAVGGTLHIEGLPGQGTTVRVEVSPSVTAPPT